MFFFNSKASENYEKFFFDFSINSISGKLIKLSEYKSMEVEKEIFSIEQKDIDKAIENLLLNFATNEEVARRKKIQKKDSQSITFSCKVEGKNIVVINRSNLVGKPLYHLLLQNNATVTTCHSKTKDLKKICLDSDIIISGVGNRDVFKLTPDMIKEGAVVIDVATTRHEEKLCGDTDYSEIIEKASFASPVPGGVGPMTVAMLLKNTVTAAALSKGIDIKS